MCQLLRIYCVIYVAVACKSRLNHVLDEECDPKFHEIVEYKIDGGIIISSFSSYE